MKKDQDPLGAALLLLVLPFKRFKSPTSLQTSHVPGACRELMRSFGWDSVDAFTQHDFQELNRILIDKVEERLKSNPALNGEIKKMFEGQLESYIECTDVNYASRKIDPFYDIALNLKADDGS